MKNFSIKELEHLSGIKRHTIRVWEHRYAALQPQRSGGNVRRYSVEELARVLTLSLLNQQHKISSLASLDEQEMTERLQGLKDEKARRCRCINGLVVSMYKMDVEAFEAQLDECFLMWPAEMVVQDILFPFLEKVNLLCQGKRKTEEHLVVTIIRKKLLWSIEKITKETDNNRTIVLFLPGERQLDLLLLFFYYQLKKTGWRVIYLGADISMQNLREILLLKQPNYLLTYVTKRDFTLLNAVSETINSQKGQATLLVVHPDGTTDNKKEQVEKIRHINYATALNLLMSQE